MIVRIEDRGTELDNIRENGYFKGLHTGLPVLDSIYSIAKGYPLYIAGSPHSGKSEFTKELALSSAIHHKFKWFCYCGEDGSAEISIAELCSKLIGKPYFGEYAMSEKERVYAHNFVSERFIFTEPTDTTLRGFYDDLKQAEKKLGIRFDGSMFDPFNDVINESAKYGGTHLWLEEDLKHTRQKAHEGNRVDIIVNHIADVSYVVDKGTNQRYIPPALPSQWAGGQVWHRRAYTMLLVYRPPSWLMDENGYPYGDNVTLIYNQKAKPKGSGKLGHCKIMWDWKANRFYEEDSSGHRKYMLEKEKTDPPKIEFNYNPNKTFEPHRTFDDNAKDAPF